MPPAGFPEAKITQTDRAQPLPWENHLPRYFWTCDLKRSGECIDRSRVSVLQQIRLSPTNTSTQYHPSRVKRRDQRVYSFGIYSFPFCGTCFTREINSTPPNKCPSIPLSSLILHIESLHDPIVLTAYAEIDRTIPFSAQPA